jgi:hypothetical protein
MQSDDQSASILKGKATSAVIIIVGCFRKEGNG